MEGRFGLDYFKPTSLFLSKKIALSNSLSPPFILAEFFCKSLSNSGG
jgi:hypothetical protein